MQYAVSDAERAEFQERGFTGVYAHPLLANGSRLGEATIAAHGRLAKSLAYPGPTHRDLEQRLDSGAMWFQSTFTVVPEIWSLASHPAVVERVKSLLGPDLIVWGASILTKQPKEVHNWHVDTTNWDGVGVFTGLRGLTRGSSLKLISRTHHLGVSPYDLIPSAPCTDIKRESPLTDDEAVLAAAHDRDPRCELMTHDISDGEFIIFDRLAWHGSRNQTANARVAATFFFARTDARVMIPTAFGSAPVWYREPPPCILVAGEDRYHYNRLVPAPSERDVIASHNIE